MEELVKKYVLQNALQYGKADAKRILGKVLGENAELRSRIAEIQKIIDEIVKEVNKMPADEQKKLLESLAPELLAEKKREKVNEFPPLEKAEKGKVVTRLAPEPSKYNHIGHALVFIIQYKYAKMYDGKCILRIEDTNPEKSTMEYYNAMKEDLGWLGLKWDEEIVVSEHMPMFYELSEKLIRSKKAFVCSCSQDKMKELREKKRTCGCRKNSVEKNLEEWKAMLARKYGEGERTLRLVGNMRSDNGVMRDPVIFRIVYARHFIQGDKYAVWPMYDFENAIEDGMRITHLIRSKEFELRIELQDYIRKLLKLNNPVVREIGRYQITGTTTQGREIREGIESGKYSGWDDPGLVTLKALRRRGFLPEMFHEFAFIVGLGKASGQITPSVFESINRKLLDPIAYRYFFISGPVKIIVKNAPEQEVELDLHSENKKGGRKFRTKTDFYITQDDYDKLEEGKISRLMDCLNFAKKGKEFLFDSLDYEIYKKNGKTIISWLPVSEELVDVEVLMPDKTIVKGLAEKGVRNIKKDTVIQFERFGFCRLDSVEEISGKKVFKFWFTHK